ncbi:MAG: MATE family efflux transporter [Pseudomonadota bacterium]
MTEASETDAPKVEPEKARFVTGSTMRHVAVMTATGSAGLVSLFVVDLLNIFYISLLGEGELAAAIGYAGTVMFFNISVSIGITIAVTALVSRALGAGDRARARRLAASGLVFSAAIMIAVAVLLLFNLTAILSLLGAEGRTLDLAVRFLAIVVPSMPLLGLGMAASGVLRAVGDAKRAMYVTLVGGAVTLVLDPIFIFGLGLGLDGAAIVSILARAAIVATGLYGAIMVHDLVGRISIKCTLEDISPLMSIAGPAILTNVATPVGNAYIIAAISDFGDSAVAGWSIVGRIIPVAFGAIFALSGAVGPIIGQNYGAKRFDRLRAVLRDSMVLTIGYCLSVWALLALSYPVIIWAFDASEDAASLIRFFCLIAAGGFLFNGLLFVANASFNNLGFPILSTVFNWGRATLGTIPFVMVGTALMGAAEGALAGQALGGVLFGTVAVYMGFRVIRRIEQNPPSDDQPPKPAWWVALSPFSSGRSATGIRT